ncbi:MAG: hypothetical protein IJ711_05555 [Lachnospiraceae bacterium]|nr:hypothetical protein [Lachnospiraceae bacterium]
MSREMNRGIIGGMRGEIKRGIKAAVLLLCLCLVMGCSGQRNTAGAEDAEELLADVSDESADVSDSGSTGTEAESGADRELTEAVSTGADSSRNFDIDLTQMSSTMVYSEVFDMMTEPERYMGKTVNMNGAFNVYQDEETGKTYYACLIQDATACCAQGIEFVLDGSYQYPADYPEEGSDITVCGTFDAYEEDGYVYCQLIDARLQ